MERRERGILAITALVLVLAPSAIGLPVVDADLLAELHEPLALPAHLGDRVLAPLLLLRMLTDVLASRPEHRVWTRRAALLVFLGLAFATGWSDAVTMQAYEGLVRIPGPAFTAAFVASQVGMSAIAWFAADRLDDIELDGAALLVLIEALLVAAQWHGDLLESVLAGLVPLWHGLSSPILPVLAVGALLLVRQPAWPVTVARGLTLRGPIPLLVLPYAVAAVLTPVLYRAWPTGSAWLDGTAAALPWLGVLLVALLVALSPSGRRRPAWILLLALGLPAWVGTNAAVVWGNGILEERYAGDERIVVAHTFPVAPTATDLEELRARLARVGIDGTLSLEDTVVTYDLRGVAAHRTLRWLERIGAQGSGVSIHRVLPMDREDRAAVLADPTHSPKDPRTWPERWEGELLVGDDCPWDCTPMLVEEAMLTAEHIRWARVFFEPRTDRVALYLGLDPAGTERLARATGGGGRIALVHDRRVLRVNAIGMEPITGGELGLDLGGGLRAGRRGRWIRRYLDARPLSVEGSTRQDVLLRQPMP